MKNISILLLFFFVAACSLGGPKNITLEVYSVPEGASIIENGKIIGQAPTTLTYAASESDVKNGYIKISPLTARWKSGAVSQEPIEYLRTESYTYELTLKRPANAPDLNIDLSVAEKIRNRREEAELQREIASAASRQQKAQNLYNFGFEMMQTGRLPNTNTTKKQINPLKQKAFLKNSYTRGMDRFCIYDNGNVVNVGGGFCRPSI